MLKFALRDITGAGLHVQKKISAEEIGLSKEEIDLRSPLTVDAVLTRAGNTVLADVHVQASYGFQCARCLEDFERPKTREFHFDYEVQSPMDEYDVGEDIRQEMILGAVVRILCKSDCKGICPGCGMNLNIEKCKCKS